MSEEFNPMYFDFKPQLFNAEGQECEYHILKDHGNHLVSEPKQINLTALTYYARLGMKPKRIGHLIGTTHTSIWNTSPLREAYEKGAAEHEVWLRVAAMAGAQTKPGLAYEMLGRAAGTIEQDVEDGMDPTEVTKSTDMKVTLNITSERSDPKIDELKALLNQRVQAANK